MPIIDWIGVHDRVQRAHSATERDRVEMCKAILAVPVFLATARLVHGTAIIECPILHPYLRLLQSRYFADLVSATSYIGEL